MNAVRPIPDHSRSAPGTHLNKESATAAYMLHTLVIRMVYGRSTFARYDRGKGLRVSDKEGCGTV